MPPSQRSKTKQMQPKKQQQQKRNTANACRSSNAHKATLGSDQEQAIEQHTSTRKAKPPEQPSLQDTLGTDEHLQWLAKPRNVKHTVAVH